MTDFAFSSIHFSSCSDQITVLRLNHAIVLMLFYSSATRPLAHRRRGDSGIKQARMVVKMQTAHPKPLTKTVSLENCQKKTV